jgi:hypothetical protein
MKTFLIGSLQRVVRALSPSGQPHAAGGALSRSLLALAGNPLWARRRWLRLFGWPGALGAGLLAMCTVFFLSTIQPAQARLHEVQQTSLTIQERVKAAANGLNHNDLTPAEQLAEFYRIFPNDKNLLPWLEKVFAVARSRGISLDQGEYRVARDKIGRLVRFQVTLPVRSSYPQIREYLNTLRTEIPIVAIEHLEFEREKVGDLNVEAKIKLALYLEHAP